MKMCVFAMFLYKSKEDRLNVCYQNYMMKDISPAASTSLHAAMRVIPREAERVRVKEKREREIKMLLK